MINLSSTVFSWWKQKQKSPKLFAKVSEKRSLITIHQVINLNGGKSLYYRNSNTLALLYLVRKRGALTPDYLQSVTGDHKIHAMRILRAWQRSNKR